VVVDLSIVARWYFEYREVKGVRTRKPLHHNIVKHKIPKALMGRDRKPTFRHTGIQDFESPRDEESRLSGMKTPKLQQLNIKRSGVVVISRYQESIFRESHRRKVRMLDIGSFEVAKCDDSGRHLLGGESWGSTFRHFGGRNFGLSGFRESKNQSSLH
jgi:hypothetical protein